MRSAPPDPFKQRRKKASASEKGGGRETARHVHEDPARLRRFPRYPLDVRVSVKVFRADSMMELWGRSIEFGQDGIGVTLTGELQTGEVGTLELTLPVSSTPLKLRGLVRYRDGLRHGFEFLARDEIQRDAISRTCELLAVGR